MRRIAFVAALAWCAAVPVHAVTPSEQLRDPRLEARARAIGSRLRCVVCQNQTIDDSDAPLAGDLRVLLRERLSAGDSDRQAIAFVVERYGRFVLLKPPLERDTLILWLAPAMVVAAGVVGTLIHARRRAGFRPAIEPLTAEEQARLSRMFEEGQA